MNDADTLHLQGLKKQLANELSSGERLLWSGMPDAATTLRATTPILLFGVPWLLFILGWEGIALAMVFHVFMENSSNTPWFVPFIMMIFGIPFVAVGVFMVGQPFAAAKKARCTLHAVTDQRVITLFYDDPLRTIDSQFVHTITGMTLKEKASLGSLQIVFGTTKDSDGDTTKIIQDWIGVPNARGAKAAILSAAYCAMKEGS
jgi:hypothetical protein